MYKSEGLSAEKIHETLTDLRAATARLGQITWRLFWSQRIAFAFGVLFLVVGFTLMNYTRAILSTNHLQSILHAKCETKLPV